MKEEGEMNTIRFPRGAELLYCIGLLALPGSNTYHYRIGVGGIETIFTWCTENHRELDADTKTMEQTETNANNLIPVSAMAGPDEANAPASSDLNIASEEMHENKQSCKTKPKDQLDVQLKVLANSFQYYHAWQPASLESLDDEYYDYIESINEIEEQASIKGNVLTVKNLPQNLDSDGLKDYFSLFGPILDASISRGRVGTVTFEEDGSDCARKVLDAQPIHIFGEAVEIQLGVNNKDKSSPKRRRGRPRRHGPFPVVVAPPNFGPWYKAPESTSRRTNNRQDQYESTTQTSETDSSDREPRGIFDKLASAASKFQSMAQNNQQQQQHHPQHNALLSSAPPALSEHHHKKSSLASLLSGDLPLEDPLFDDDEHYVGDSTHLMGASLHKNGAHREGHRKARGLKDGTQRERKSNYFNSDNTLHSWIWASVSGENSPCSKPESDLHRVLVRGRATNANLPLLATTSGVYTCDNTKATDQDESWLDQTNLSLLYKSTDVEVKRSSKSQTLDDVANMEGCRDGQYELFQARHPCLAPLISVTKCTASSESDQSLDANQENDSGNLFDSVVSIFDITHSRHRSLHELLRTEDFFTKPLFLCVDEPEQENVIGHCANKESPQSWFHGEESGGCCSCHNYPDEDSGLMQKQISDGNNHSTSEPNLLEEESKHDMDIHSMHLFGDLNLQKLRKGGAELIRRRRPRKMFKVGSSHRADVADLRIRFFALQLFHAVNFCHRQGISLGEQLSPERLFIQDDGWVRLVLPITKPNPSQMQESENVSESNSEHDQNSTGLLASVGGSPRKEWRSIFHNNDAQKVPGRLDIVPYPGYGDTPTLLWARGQLTNLCYLMMINEAAGRTVGDYANPPIFPWVTNFAQEIHLETDLGKLENNNPWRDLTRSKFRLKKGDEQLDQTFIHHTPRHHVPENICSLTYTVYRARVLPIDHLKTTVREDFVAAQYPGSVQSLYDWTPDEATIEFYTPSVPSIFDSIHKGDMNDLELPPWCSTSTDFIGYHRRLLESSYVTRQLHLWIDLNFGSALSGRRAIAEKNVVLSSMTWANGGVQDQCKGKCHLVFNEATVDENHRAALSFQQSSHFVQVFVAPHPRKHSKVRETVTQALRALNQNNSGANATSAKQEKARAMMNEGELLPFYDDEADFQARKQRDSSALGAILQQCYSSACVIPPPAVDTAIDKLLSGTLDLRRSLKDFIPNRESSDLFPFFQQLHGVYQILSSTQNLSFHRKSSATDCVDGHAATTRSTDLDQVWKLVQTPQRLESLSSSSTGLILPTLLLPLTTVDAFVENCVTGYKSFFANRFCSYLVALCNITSGDFVLPLLLKFLGNAFSCVGTDSQELGKIILSAPLLHTLSLSSHGEPFIKQVISFTAKQICSEGINCDPEKVRLHILFLSLLAQDEMLGAAICCKYIVPSLVYIIDRSSAAYYEQSVAIEALKSLVPSLPEDAIGILICKPFFRNIIPAQLREERLWANTLPQTASHHDDSTTAERYKLLSDSITLVHKAVSHLHPKAVGKYCVQSNAALSLGQILSMSFEAISKPTSELADGAGKELLKEATILVCNIIGRVEDSDYRTRSDIFVIAENFCSQVNDAYVSIVLGKHQCDADRLPGIQDALLMSERAMQVCGRKQLELLCPSALEFLSWINQRRGIIDQAKGASAEPTNEDQEKEYTGSEQSSSYTDNLQETTGDGLSLEMRAPKKQVRPGPEGDHMVLSDSDRILQDKISPIASNDSINDTTQQTASSFTETGEHSKSKRDLAWLLGLHKEEREGSIRYLWQPRMMLATLLEDKVSVDENEIVAITCLRANQSETLLAAGNNRGEVLLFDLRRHPPALVHKQLFDNHDSKVGKLQPIRQVEFLNNQGDLLVCNGDLHLFSTEKQTVLSSLSPENANRFSCTEAHKMLSWKGDSFVDFSLLPKGSGIGEVYGGAIAEIAAISSKYVYTIDIRCGDTAVDFHKLIWPDTGPNHPKKHKIDHMFRSLNWNTPTSFPWQEELIKSQPSLQVNNDTAASFELLCVTAHEDWICTGSSSGHIHCFDRRWGKILNCWKAHAKPVEYVKAISRQRLLSASGDKMAILWDLTKSPPQKLSSIYNIPGKEYAMNITSHQFIDDGLVSIPGDNKLLFCAAAGRKAVFMPMPQEDQSDGQPQDVLAIRHVMCDFHGNRVQSSEKLSISSIALLPCRQLVLLGCDQGEIHVCL